jgi:hypothetical protein
LHPIQSHKAGRGSEIRKDDSLQLSLLAHLLPIH